MELSELFGQLRGLLDETPTQDLWGRITRELDHFDDDLLLEEVVSPYLLSCFKKWPADLIRRPWPSWYEEGRSPGRKRALHALSTAPCPVCKEGRGVDEVKRALKLQYGKRYSSTVRVRDLMTGRADAIWACDACRRFPCPRCEQERTFDEMGAALYRIYAREERHSNDLAREVARQASSREWVCEPCLDDGAIVSWRPPPPEPEHPHAPLRRTSRRSRRADRAPEARYVSFTNRCKVCSSDFVFSAEEQRVWHEEYGIPRFYEGVYGSQELIVRSRCDTCQALHIAQKRIGQILREGYREDQPEPHRTLERHYTTLGNDQKAGYHRNIANRLEGGD